MQGPNYQYKTKKSLDCDKSVSPLVSAQLVLDF